MISNQALEQALQTLEGVCFVSVDGDGHHYAITLVTDAFVGLNKLARQRWVYAALNEYILSGQLHAVQLKTWTKAEWEAQRG